MTTPAPQRTPICDECEDTIIYVPRAGFGREGEWRHLAPPKIGTPAHDPRPRVFIT